ncbi:23S rRNA protein [Winogradskyella psychrotolerans RS-3]|uniref:23S rRNA protein n=2 Tax=Winogradskyella TaxID=286104 RepID=S7X3D4_9FLAO|nr:MULTISPECIES: four helix bundle protein [Winogradskyella]EPR70613.1 23S rRNA protein [Winogradskyella psychrotolerans RS-3]REE08264.1 four helix bundle protein [Winogradskyella pacifica]
MKVQDLIAYKKGFKLAMDIFHLSKKFPREETYSLTDQIRRSSRSVCANLSEAYRKRRYPKHFISKLTDCDAENGETQTWLEFALACDYISNETYNNLLKESQDVANLLNYMILNPKKFGSSES